MPVQMLLNKGAVPVKVWTSDIQSAAIDQLTQLSMLPIIHNHVAVMPDVHAGIGSTIGSVIPTHKAIIPAAVGVDIGCGMLAVQLSLTANDLPDNLSQARSDIEQAVPVGFNKHDSADIRSISANRLDKGYQVLMAKYPALVKMQKAQKDADAWARQIGTLGGGNHFIELCLDESDNVWVMLHSGSRGIGNQIGRYFIEIAKKDMEKVDVHLPLSDLAYFQEGSEHFDGYVEAVDWAQSYAAENRSEMLDLVLGALAKTLPDFSVVDHAINCHHNYVSKEAHFGKDVFVTRKGAIRAGKGEMGIIPGSMGARSFIVRGLGNEESFCSCSHGAGRKMSRSQAKKVFSRDDLIAQTDGVECRKDEGVIDEAPGAYKSIDEVMANQCDLVEAVHTLKQVLCVKG